MRYVELLNETPQTEPSDPRQVQNSAGGFVFQISKWERLQRFLVLGSDSNTFYATAQKLTKDNAACVLECLKGDGPLAVSVIGELSQAGRAPKNDAAIFALALALVHGDEATKRAARLWVPLVCRTGTHLFQLVSALNALGGWGRGTKSAVARWYLDKAPAQLAYQLLKYQSREGWSHRDVMRLAHPKTKHAPTNAVLRWAVDREARGERVVKRGKGEAASSVTYAAPEALPPLLIAYDELLQPGIEKARVVELVTKHRLTHEMVPGQWKDDREVWEALLGHMPIGALIRNLGQLTARGLLADGSVWANHAALALANQAHLKAGRIHPISVLSALRTYQSGRGVRGKLTWQPVKRVVDALEAAFYMSFGTLEPTNKSTLLALDVSGSMTVGTIGGVPGLTPREAAAAMAMVVARTEPKHAIVAYSSQIIHLPIRADMRLGQVMDMTADLPFQSTDCAQPFLWAMAHSLRFEATVSITDNESFAGRVHVHEALRRYRVLVPESKFVAVAMTATEFSVAEPGDRHSLNIAGFDSAAPAVIADFIRGESRGAVLETGAD